MLVRVLFLNMPVLFLNKLPSREGKFMLTLIFLSLLLFYLFCFLRQGLIGRLGSNS